MTNERVGSFVSDLVEMAKAVERVPELEAQLNYAQSVAESRSDFISRLQSDLDQARTYAASLEQRCHDLEVQRDAAELRFLESDDAVGTLKRAMRIAMGEVDGALKAVEPPKPEPVPEPMVTDHPLVDGPLLYAGGGDGSFNESDEPKAEVFEVPVDPIANSTSDHSATSVETMDLATTSTILTEEAPADATTDPTASGIHGSESVTVSDQAVDGSSNAASPPNDTVVSVPPSPTASSSPTPTSPNAPPVEPSTGAASDSDHGLYFGKLYTDYPAYVSLHDWLIGGGTEADYFFRRSI